MKEVMIQNNFSFCPHCMAKVFLLESAFSLYMFDDQNGKYPNRLLNSETDYTIICPRCGYRHAMVKTMQGLFPKEHMYVEQEQQMMNEKPQDRLLIGYVDEEEHK